MILLARESRGITQSSLAKQLGVTQAAVSKAEKIQGKVSENLLEKIAKVLIYPVGFFLQPGHSYPPATPLHRKQKGLGKKLQHKIEAEANIRRLHIQKLLDSIDVEGKSIPVFEIDEYETAQNVASALRRYLRLPKGPVANMTAIIEGFGIAVILCNFYSEKIDGFTLFGKANVPLVFINKQMPWCRIRFTLAHELGHIVMNHVPGANIEEEANEFASSFLMPKEDIEKDFHLKILSLSDLANLKPYWKVSMQAILTRATRLGFLTKDKARRLWMNLSSAGYRKREPSYIDIQPENPTLLTSVLDLHRTNLEYTESELLTMLGSYKDDFFSLYPSLRKEERNRIKLKLV